MRTWITILFVLLLFVAVDKQQSNAAPQSTLAIVAASDAVCGGLFFKRRICPAPMCPMPNTPEPPPKIEPAPIPEFIATPVTSDAVLGGIFFNRPGKICPGPNCPTPNTPGPPPEILPPPIPEPEPVEPPIVNVIVNDSKPEPEPEPESDISWILVAFAGLASMIGFYAMEASS